MRLVGLVVLSMMIVVACGSDDTAAPGASPGSTGATAPAEPGAQPSLEPGTSALGEVTIDGTVIEYVTVVPRDFAVGDRAPVLIALPPGGQDIALTLNVTQGVYQREALARGWVVVSPAAPDRELFFDGSERLIPGFLNFVESWVTPEGGGFHLAGISNGGISSFRVATENPARFRSVTVFPGFPRSDADMAGLDAISDIPVRMFVGGNDVGWIGRMEEAADRLSELGGDVTFEIFAGEDHVIGSLSDGVRVFDELDAAR